MMRHFCAAPRESGSFGLANTSRTAIFPENRRANDQSHQAFAGSAVDFDRPAWPRSRIFAAQNGREWR
jgi:hypothetical protein